MLLVPGLGLMRQFGSGKPFSVFGIPMFPERPVKVEWMMIPGDLLHYWLGFLLLALAIGHVAAAIVHKFWWKDAVVGRVT
jgi:cytochrome b561